MNHKPFLQQQIGKKVLIRLKWGLEYKGFLVSTDNYMNFQVRWMGRRLSCLYTQLANTEEIQDGKSNGTLGEVFIRCNNVLYLRELNEDP